MLLRYFFDPKLAHASYMVACQATGEAIIIDPGRNPFNQPLVLQCLSGFRSSIAASLLASRGWTNMMNLRGGYQAWLQAMQPVIVNIHQ